MGLTQSTAPPGRLLIAAVVAAPLALVGCTGKDLVHPGSRAAPPAVTVSPAGGKGVPVSTEIGTKVSGGKVESVTLTDTAGGGKVSGGMRADGTSWIPSKPLRYKHTYDATVTARGEQGKTTTTTSRFTTMAQPQKQTTTWLYFQNGEKYGNAMPVTVAFDPPVPRSQRASVQKRLFVTTTPEQQGVWSWVGDGSQVYYRAQDFWKPGTKISVRTGTGGLPLGNGRFGDQDHSASASITAHPVSANIDDRTKLMSVYREGKLLRKIPVSMGKPSTPTSSGRMVIMEKFDTTVFDTRGDPAGGYVVRVYDAQRLTWGGEFIHAAPWSVGSQGYDNVSHGCTNVSDENAAWLMRVTHVGDMVTIRNTGTKLRAGNGWTAWDVSWPEYVKGSALPVPADLAAVRKPAPAKTTPPPAAAGSPTAPGASAPAPAKPANNGR